MISVKLMHFLYTLRLQLLLKKLYKKQKINKNLLNNIVEILKNNEDIINLYLSVQLKTILRYNTKGQEKNIKYPISKIYHNGKEVNFKAIKMYIERYIYIHSKYLVAYREYNKVKKQIITYKLYKKIVHKTNKKVLNRILEENYIFTPTKAFGGIGIIKNKNNRVSINWGESLKAKQKLIDEGKIPYKKEDAKNDPNYKGVYWLVKNPEIDFYYQWFKCTYLIKYARRLRYFQFEPSRGKISAVSKLAEKKQDREFAFNTYTNTLPDYEGI